MCNEETERKISRIKGFNRYGQSIIESPNQAEIDKLKGAWQFIKIQYDNNEIELITITWDKNNKPCFKTEKAIQF